MKLVTYRYNNEVSVGLMIGEDKILSLRDYMEEKGFETGNLNELIDHWSPALANEMDNLLKTSSKTLVLSEVDLLAPVPYPKRHVLCLGKNYIDHAKETQGLPGSMDELPKFPIYFNKAAEPAVGHETVIKAHDNLTDMVDYEVELALVIGKDGIDISKEEAEDYIFGYTILNDISARNLQRKHMQWFKGKSLETFCPMGPCIVTKDEIPFPVVLNIQCSINGEMRQDSNTDQLIFDIPTIIEDLSKGMYLRKGDIIATGTPAGVGLGFKPYKFLKQGDRIDCSIEKIGRLTNYFGYKKSPL